MLELIADSTQIRQLLYGDVIMDKNSPPVRSWCWWKGKVEILREDCSKVGHKKPKKKKKQKKKTFAARGGGVRWKCPSC